jgi:Ni,Fe-hydrogenase III small subunit
MMNRLRGVLAVVAAVSLVVACGGGAPESNPEPSTVLASGAFSRDSGVVQQHDAGVVRELVPCDCKTHTQCAPRSCMAPQAAGGGAAECDAFSGGNTGQCR